MKKNFSDNALATDIHRGSMQLMKSGELEQLSYINCDLPTDKEMSPEVRSQVRQCIHEALASCRESAFEIWGMSNDLITILIEESAKLASRH